MCTFIDTLKADSVEEVLKQYWLAKAVICFSQDWHRIISLCVKTKSVASYIDNFRKTLNKYVVASNIFNCNISYIDIAGKLIAYYSLSERTRFNIFDFAKKPNFRKSKFQQVKIYEIPDNNKTRYKINAATTEKCLLTLFMSIVENLLIGKRLIRNDVIKLLPSFNWEIHIVLFYLLELRIL